MKKTTFNDELKATIYIDNLTSQYQRYVFYCSVDFLILDKEGSTYSTYYINDPSVWNVDQTKQYLDQIEENDLNYTYFSSSMKELGSDSDKKVLCIGKKYKKL